MSITACENLPPLKSRPPVHGEIVYLTPLNRAYYYDEAKEKYSMLTMLYDFGISYPEAIEAFGLNGKKITSWTTEDGAAEPTFFNCRNCGAPVKGHRCEYCETRY